MARQLFDMLQDAGITNEVLAASRGERVTLSDDALVWLKARLSAFTPSDVTHVLGLSIFEAHKLIRRLISQSALSDKVSAVKKRNGTEWSYAWA